MDHQFKMTTKTEDAEYDQNDDHMIYQDFMIDANEQHTITSAVTSGGVGTAMDYANIEPFNLNKLN